MSLLLFLKRDNLITVVSDWVYPLFPTTVYNYREPYIVETYEIDYVCKDGNSAFYKYVEERDSS